jgi:GNAT superfamily N-acetyltransferase
MPPVRLRAARPDEAAALTALALRSKAHWGYDATFMAQCVAELTVTAAMLERGLALVAERVGVAVGFILCDPVERNRAELHMIFVEPAAAGQGIGAALVQAAFTELAGRGVGEVAVTADPNAEGFYRTCGFRRTGMEPSGSIPGRLLPRLGCRLSHVQ